jgi:hypothetical protein
MGLAVATKVSAGVAVVTVETTILAVGVGVTFTGAAGPGVQAEKNNTDAVSALKTFARYRFFNVGISLSSFPSVYMDTRTGSSEILLCSADDRQTVVTH